jgi:cyclophilin family peptidyl-prolyl cis-trans isomerase
MLSEIPNDIVLQILKECVPKAVENFGLTSQKSYHFVRRYRHLLPKFQVFLSVVYNGKKFEITANLAIDGSSILDQWDSIHFK